jgi:RES domain-containing protein
MIVYRIDRLKYLSEALSGRGAAASAGNRWNLLYTPMVYTAESRALAILEIAVHLDLNEDLPTDRHLVSIEIPDEIAIKSLAIGELPPLWNAKPPLRNTQLVGNEFIKKREFAILRVPNSIVPKEYNYLINPMHAQSSEISVIHSEPLLFDSRLVP